MSATTRRAWIRGRAWLVSGPPGRVLAFVIDIAVGIYNHKTGRRSADTVR